MFRTKLQTAKVGFITWVSVTYRRLTLTWQGKEWGAPVPSEEKEQGLWKFGNYCLKALSSCPHPTEAGCLPSICLTILLPTVFPAPQHHLLSLTWPSFHFLMLHNGCVTWLSRRARAFILTLHLFLC